MFALAAARSLNARMLVPVTQKVTQELKREGLCPPDCPGETGVRAFRRSTQDKERHA
jgi:hypothetical protein